MKHVHMAQYNAVQRQWESIWKQHSVFFKELTEDLEKRLQREIGI